MQFVIDNIFPLGIGLFSGVMLLWNLFGNRLRGIQAVDSHAALQLINHKNAFILDVREPDEYKAGHLLNAKLIPLGELKSRVSQLEKYRNDAIVVVCRSGNRSASACVTLKQAGFAQAYNLSGGVMAWQRAKLPLIK